MQANKFVKEHGWDEAKNLIAASGWRNTPFLIKIKRLVDSWELVQSFGSLENTKKILNDMHDDDLVEVDESQALYSAIADVESCQ